MIGRMVSLCLLLAVCWSPRACAESADTLVVRAYAQLGGGALLMRPHGICRDERGLFYVSDTSNHRIVVFDSAGRERGQIGDVGSGPGEFLSPTALVASEEQLAVYDSGNERVQIFSLPSRRFLREVPVPQGTQSVCLREDGLTIQAPLPYEGGLLRRIDWAGRTVEAYVEPMRGATESVTRSLNRCFFASHRDMTVVGFQSLSLLRVYRGSSLLATLDLRTPDTPFIRSNFRAARALDAGTSFDPSQVPTPGDLRADLEQACADGQEHFISYIAGVGIAGDAIYVLCYGRVYEYRLDLTLRRVLIPQGNDGEAIYSHRMYVDGDLLALVDVAHTACARLFHIPPYVHHGGGVVTDAGR